MKTYAIIPSGGQGKRFGYDIPKQYLKVNGKELIAFTLEVFEKSEFVDEIIVAAQKDYFDLLEQIKHNYGITKLVKVIEGGKERQDSVYNALSSLSAENNDLVAVHDAARPLLPLKILNSAVLSAKELGNSVLALKARDTLVNAPTDELNYLNRSYVFYIQTPQIFRFGILKKAMENAFKEKFDGTDESILVSRSGEKIHFVEGAFENFKITTKSDFDLFAKLCR